MSTIPILTEEQRLNFCVQHFSPSSIRKFLENPQAFFKSYIRYEYDDSISPALVEGNAMHRVLAKFYEKRLNTPDSRIAFDWESIADEMIAECFTDEAIKTMKWGKTGSLEKSTSTVHTALQSYSAELPAIEHIISVEERFLTDFEDLENTPMPIPLKGFIDLVTLEGDDYVIRDHKFIASFSDPTNLADIAKYEMQAVPYFFMVRKRYGKNPKCMIFDELKKSKNRDGSPQRQQVIIDYTPKVLNRWIEIYKRVVKTLAGIPLIDPQTGVMQFLPNPFAQFGEDAWYDFCEEVDHGKVWTFNEIKEIRASKYTRAEEIEALF